MSNKIIKAGSAFDWITPGVIAPLNRLRRGSGYTFCIPLATVPGRTGRDLVEIVRARGVDTWAHMIVNDHAMFTVRKLDADEARRALMRAGVPL